MALPREASSLSSITHLAGNPPRYPRNPTEGKRESLVLYIARVPGSRDVILMTMKPRLKNVTAEDVLNCLYYLHVDMPDDLLLLESQSDLSNAEVSQPPPQAPVHRKPLRENSPLLVPSETEMLAQKNGLAGSDSSVKPEIPHWVPPLPERPLSERKSSPVRRPLGPRTLHSQPHLGQKPFPGVENAPLRNTHMPSDDRPQLNITSPHSQNSNLDNSLTGMRNTDEFPTPLLNTTASSRNDQLLITLIRRDPTSGAQWNIGTIQCHSHINSKPSNLGKCSSVSVHLTTLGYGQFQPPKEAAASMAALEPQELTASQPGFDRQVRMDWSSQLGGKFKYHRRGISDPSNDGQVNQAKDRTEIAGFKHDGYGIPTPKISKSPDCGFLSPWNGRCEFSSGSSGRTLKCKHILPGHMAVTSSDAKATVSELRFNLPSSVYAGGNNQNTGRSFRPSLLHVRGKSSLDSSASHSLKPDPTSYAAMYPSDDEGDDDEDDLDDGFDPLSLGREKAGGGIRGKRVKLGKLIVHDEGLKMLDLVVAANMGIWWTVWDG